MSIVFAVLGAALSSLLKDLEELEILERMEIIEFLYIYSVVISLSRTSIGRYFYSRGSRTMKCPLP